MKTDILIFSASTGHGHNAAANSLKKELELQGYTVAIIEPIKEASKSLDTLIADGYKVLATKLPYVFGALYKISNYQTVSNRISRIFINAVENKIDELVNYHKPSLVISTHPLLVSVISALKREEKIRAPFVSVITDYQAHQAYVNSQVDAYIAGCEQTKQSLMARGIEPDKIFSYGIPVKREFQTPAVNIQRDERFTILLMGGSMGVNGMKRALKNIMEVDYPVKVIAVCGNNNSLRSSIEHKYACLFDRIDKTVHVLGFTNNVHELMDVSDIIVSKPGGLTVTESLSKRIPMVIPYYIPGQEKENTTVLVEAGAAISVDIKDIKHTINRMIEEPNILLNLKQNIEKITDTYSLDNTIHLLVQFMERYNLKR